jgi:hypothetical protein
VIIGMRRLLLAMLVASLSATALGAAASLSFSTGSLGAAQVSVPRCASGALSVLPNLSASNVTSVTIGGIPAACAGATLKVTVNNGASNSSGSATIAAGGGSAIVTLAAAVAVTTTVQTDLVVDGP